VPTFTSISRLRVEPDDVAEVLAEVRALVREHDHREAMWWVGSSATPTDLVDRLQTHGLVPDERPGSEPHATSMVLVNEPPAGPPDVVARRVASLAEYRITNKVSAVAFDVNPEDAAAWEAIAEERWAAELEGDGRSTYIAYLDGEPVARARTILDADCPAVLMIGGGVLPEARGRGVYRALVRARWDDAVAAGKPALCTHAGKLSRPVLERLGFEPVAEIELLLDPST
jgi:GNAT superfamily N-acetyltransferase